METESTMAKNLRIAQEKANYDAACKKLLSEKSILARILKNCVAEFAEESLEDIENRYIEGTPQVSEAPVAPDEEGASQITGLDTADKTQNEGSVFYDIRFVALAPGTNERIRLIINVEAQSDFYPGYPLVKRGVYYGCRMISSQYGKEFSESHYENIKKVYSIWICTNPPVNRQNTISCYHITEDNMVGHVEEKKENYDLLTVLMICLGKSGETTGLLRLLDVLFTDERKQEEKQKILEDEFQLPMKQQLEMEVGLMCNLSEGVWQRGIEQGMQQGIQQGIQQGMQQGIQQGMQQGIEQGIEQVALNMYKKGLSVEEIADYTSLSILEVRKVLS